MAAPCVASVSNQVLQANRNYLAGTARLRRVTDDAVNAERSDACRATFARRTTEWAILLTGRKRETTGSIAPYRCCIWASRRSEKGSSLDHGRETNEPSAPGIRLVLSSSAAASSTAPSATSGKTGGVGRRDPGRHPGNVHLGDSGRRPSFRLPSPLAQAKWDPD